MCGYPASGKTTRCNELKEYFSQKHGKRVEVIDDDMLELNKNTVYSCEYRHVDDGERETASLLNRTMVV